MPAAYSSFRVRINLLGATALIAYVCMALLSYLQAPALWRSEIAAAPRARVFLKGLDAQLSAIPGSSLVSSALSGPFVSNLGVLVVYWIPLALASVAMLALVLLLARYRELADAAIARLLFRWALAFAAGCALAFPMFTQDLWISAVWGRMIADGVNPYHQYFTLKSLRGFPVDHFPMIMTYGPLWAVISGAIMAIARNNVLITAILFKSLIAAAWIGSLALVRRLMRNKSSFDLCLATALFGWTPLGVTQFLAEGHNDIVMMFLVLLWLSLLLRGHWTAPVALMSSALCKYVTAPLFLIDAIHVLRVQGVHWRTYLYRLAVPAVLGVAVFALFFRSPQFFDGLKVISKWHFLQPRDAISALEDLIGFPLLPLTFIVSALFPLLAAYFCIEYFRHPTLENLLKAAVAITSAICFTAVSHLWPWYMIWGVAFAVQIPTWWLSRFVIAVAVVIPFAVVWWVSPYAHQMAALLVYVAAILATLGTRRASDSDAK
jgi:alpha-1,6-mannosyltransferase